MARERRENKFREHYRSDAGEAHFYRGQTITVPTCVGDIPIGKRTPTDRLNNLTLKEIRNGVDQHRFNPRELEYIVGSLVMKIEVYLNNKFVCY